MSSHTPKDGLASQPLREGRGKKRRAPQAYVRPLEFDRRCAPGIISIVTGSYNESLTIKKRVTLIAPVGKVMIGQ